MSDWYQRAAERMAMEIATDSDACAIMATRRVRAVQADSGAMPTAEDYRLALVQCVVEKAADWRAACESARLASAEIGLAFLAGLAVAAMIEMCEGETQTAAWLEEGR